jgi:hypothetical protein
MTLAEKPYYLYRKILALLKVTNLQYFLHSMFKNKSTHFIQLRAHHNSLTEDKAVLY